MVSSTAAEDRDSKFDPYAAKPWLALYGGKPERIITDFGDALAIFRAAVARAPDRPAVHYFDQSLTYAQVNALSDGLASWFADHDIGRGDRFALVLQNVPQFLVGLVAAWKRGAIPVPINPMNRARELSALFGDCRPKALICHPDHLAEVEAALATVPAPVHVLTTSARDFQSRDDARVMAGAEARTPGDPHDLMTILDGRETRKPWCHEVRSEDVAFLVYTSGTTGVPKGAMITHGNTAFNAQVYRDWMDLEDGKPLLALAPLFHVTGLIGHIAAAFISAAPLVLSYRFEPDVMLDSIREHRPQFIIGAITAFVAMMNAPSAASDSFATVGKIYSGGAPIPPAVVEAFEAKFGHYIHNGYGLTETTSPSHCVPFGCPAPVDPTSGALAVGVPIFSTRVRIADDNGDPLPVGELGEIVTKGPQVIPGYWNKPVETAESIQDGWLRTGDIGFMDEAGWFYLVDRKKDMINAAGYKVWPREVEDVLYTHPAVREAAVVGIPDDYRGETVKAVVSLKPGAAATPEALVAFCKERMAAYKYPRIIEVIDDLPKTVTGKILRRELRPTTASAPERPQPLTRSDFEK